MHMRCVMSVALLMSVATAAMPAPACECARPIDESRMREAPQVFVMRLRSVEALQAAQGGYPLRGRIEIVERLRGDAQVATIRYSGNPQCCGLRLDPGRYYLVAADTAGAELQVGHTDLLSLGWDYRGDAEASARLRATLAGRAKLDPRWLQRGERMQQVAPPPLPCPRRPWRVAAAACAGRDAVGVAFKPIPTSATPPPRPAAETPPDRTAWRPRPGARRAS